MLIGEWHGHKIELKFNWSDKPELVLDGVYRVKPEPNDTKSLAEVEAFSHFADRPFQLTWVLYPDELKIFELPKRVITLPDAYIKSLVVAPDYSSRMAPHFPNDYDLIITNDDTIYGDVGLKVAYLSKTKPTISSLVFEFANLKSVRYSIFVEPIYASTEMYLMYRSGEVVWLQHYITNEVYRMRQVQENTWRDRRGAILQKIKGKYRLVKSNVVSDIDFD